MAKPNAILLLLMVVYGGLLVSSQIPIKPTFFREDCDDMVDDYDYDSKHSTNVRTVLKELTKQGSVSYFYNSSAGKGKDKVYGQYYCRTDISSDLCGQCIQAASINNCIGGVYATIYYEECTLRYENISNVGVYDTISYLSGTSPDRVTDSEKFGSVVNSTLDRIISQVVNSNGSLYQATGEGVVSENETVYCLVQCSPDLNLTACTVCISTARDIVVGALFTDLTWTRWVSMFAEECQLRYSNHGTFYRLNNPAIPPALSPDSPSNPSQIPQTPHPTGPQGNKGSNYYVIRVVIPIVVIGALTILGISLCLIRQKNKAQKLTTVIETDAETSDCMQFDLKTIEDATNSFSPSNKLGQGGFDIVYQGILSDGQAIAVKRLSKCSTQGITEFKTEVGVLAKLLHKNLVQLVGCCVDGEERLLVYEFLCNLSLDRFLFDTNKAAYLTWEIRHKIIQGIARGLHYLHEDLRVKIVHRDLKTSNILLADNLDPKIADFGLARLVKVDQTSSNTTKVVGTYGYMSPEYALAGRYSIKSDVYSFGVIVLEILSGKSNNMFYDISHSKGLLQHAWRVWNEGAIEKLMDSIIHNSYSRIEAERCLQIGLLCVQDDATCRPTMHDVLIMLNTNTVDLPSPVSPSHYNYINTLPSVEETQERFIKQQEDESGLPSTTFTTITDLSGR